MTTTHIFSANGIQVQDDLAIPISVFRSIYDSGQIKNFAFAEELESDKPPRNPLVITPDDEGKDFAENADFTLNATITWGDLIEILSYRATERQDNKESAMLFSPTIYTTKLFLESPVKPARGFRGEKNATISAVLFIDADNKDTTNLLLFDEAVTRLQQEGVEAIVYTTASNKAGEHFRVVVPLTNPVDAATHREAVEAVCRCLKTGWASDTTKNNCFSLFYFPGIYPGADNQYTHVHGSSRTAQEWIGLYPAPPQPTRDAAQIEPKPPRDDLDLRRDGAWTPEKYPGVAKYRGLGHGRHAGLYGMMTSVAMSTINDGYDLTDYELADFAGWEQASNPPKHRYTSHDLLVSARKALDNAKLRVTDPAYEKRAAYEAYQAAEMERFRRDMAEDDITYDRADDDDEPDEYDDQDTLTRDASQDAPGDQQRPSKPANETSTTKRPILSPATPTLSAKAFIERRQQPIIFWRDEKGGTFFPLQKHITEVVAATELQVLMNPRREPHTYPNGTDMRDMIACHNGLLNFTTGEMLPHDPGCLVFNCLPFDYTPTLPAPTQWFAFLHSLWPDDDGDEGGNIAALQEMIGYLLSGRTDLQKIFLLIGPPRSGKGTIAWMIDKLMGSDNVIGMQLAGFALNFGLASAVGKSVVILPDARPSHRADLGSLTERMLNISGEDPISIPRKYKEDWSGKLLARLVILSNEVPRLPDASGAIATRFVPVKMTESFVGKEDITLKDKLHPELPQILLWGLEGLRRLTERGNFMISKTADDVFDDLRNAAAPHLMFIEDCLNIDPVYAERKQAVYAAYTEWCKQNGYNACNENQFSQRLRMAIPGLIDYRPQTKGKRGQRHWKGLSLKYMSDPPDDLQSDMRNDPPTRTDDALWELMEKADPTLRGDATTDDDNPRWMRGVCDD